MSYRPEVAPVDRERFAKYASPSAIAATIRRVKESLEQGTDEYQWLSGVYEARMLQVERGEWPIQTETRPGYDRDPRGLFVERAEEG